MRNGGQTFRAAEPYWHGRPVQLASCAKNTIRCRFGFPRSQMRPSRTQLPQPGATQREGRPRPAVLVTSPNRCPKRRSEPARPGFRRRQFGYARPSIRYSPSCVTWPGRGTQKHRRRCRDHVPRRIRVAVPDRTGDRARSLRYGWFSCNRGACAHLLGLDAEKCMLALGIV